MAAHALFRAVLECCKIMGRALGLLVRYSNKREREKAFFKKSSTQKRTPFLYKRKIYPTR